MQLSFDPRPFDLLGGLKVWGVVCLVVVALAWGIAGLLMFLQSGAPGLARLIDLTTGLIRDFLQTSPRRVWALAVHTFREAARKRALWVFAVFAVLFLFAGWFMPELKQSPDMAIRNYVSFVLRTITWLTIPVVGLLACWGLPEDIRLRSLHTVVTKPVRRQEIVLGRIVGFLGIGLLVLLIVGSVGYVWIVRQVPENFGQVTARVPIYGELRFLTREGTSEDEQGMEASGVNVGDEAIFRQFVEGNTQARAIWRFEGVDMNRLQNGQLILESTFQSFRTHKGKVDQELLGQFTLVNPKNGVRVPLQTFFNREFRRNSYNVTERNSRGEGGKLELKDEQGRTVDLAKDVLDGGQLDVEVACLSPGQFMGMARPDLFIRLPDRAFLTAYGKGLFSIFILLTMIVVLGVMSGCFLKGPVATMLTGFIFLVGRLSHDFLQHLTSDKLLDNPKLQMRGRGLLESLYRLPTHLGPQIEVEDNTTQRVIKAIDNIELNALWGVKYLFPDFTQFDATAFVANSFDVPWDAALLPNLATTIGFCVPWIIVGYFALKCRELEAK
ncbi:MAG: ABC transporter permease [Planctomycetaceae bacterium]